MTDLRSFGGKVCVVPSITLLNVIFAPSKLKRLTSDQRNPLKTSSFLLSVRTLFSASVASVAVIGIQLPLLLQRFINKVFKSAIAASLLPDRAAHSARIRNNSSVA